MKYKFKTNTACLFHSVNQWDETISRMMCTIYFWFINAKYNGVIKDFTEADILKVAERQVKAWKFNYTTWWKLVDWIEAVVNYITNDLKTPCNLWSTDSDIEAMDWINRWFAVWIWIKVNKTFLEDRKDWKLNTLDYKDLKWDMWHATNIAKYNCRWLQCSDIWKEFFLDSYFVSDSTYSCNIKEVLEDIEMITKFVIF